MREIIDLKRIELWQGSVSLYGGHPWDTVFCGLTAKDIADLIASHKALQRRVEEHAEEIAKLQQALIGSMDANFKLMEAGCNKLTPPHEARG